MYSDLFCKVYNEFGWNYYPEIFGEQLLIWLRQNGVDARTGMDLACGTGVLCGILSEHGIKAAGMDYSPGMIETAKSNYPDLSFEVADMITFRPEQQYDLVTCTGDALNHIERISDLEKIFQNVYEYTSPGGYFIFDILDEKEISTSEPFEMDFTETTRVWFQMTRPAWNKVNLNIKVFENGIEQFSEIISETVHDQKEICALLEKCGFHIVKCSHRLTDDEGNQATTWFVIAKAGVLESPEK